MPVPNWSPDLERRLAGETRNVLSIYQKLHRHQEKYGVEQGRDISVSRALQASGLPTLRLEDLVLRGDIALNGATQYSLGVMHSRGLLAFSPQLDAASIRAIESVIRANGKASYLKEGKDVLVPNPRVATTFLEKVHEVSQERSTLVEQVAHAQQTLDTMVVDAYGITVYEWRSAIENGVPWARN